MADAFFSKFPFVKALGQMGFHIISRLQSNADLRYLHRGEKKKTRGRPKKYDGKIDLKNLKLDYFDSFDYNGQTCFSAVVYSIALKQKILIIIERVQE